MKKLNDVLINMVYPMLISLFIFVFAEGFVKGGYLEPIELVSILFTIFFGILFVVGFVLKIIEAIKDNSKR